MIDDKHAVTIKQAVHKLITFLYGSFHSKTMRNSNVFGPRANSSSRLDAAFVLEELWFYDGQSGRITYGQPPNPKISYKS
jgi:hypothetical protein